MDRRKKQRYQTKRHRRLLQETRLITRQIPLSDRDRITYAYRKEQTTRRIREVVTVSYDAWMQEQWVTILRYDSTHGYLHQHTRIALTSKKEFISQEHILQTGSQQDWLTFAIEDIKANYQMYRRAFFTRSELDDNTD